MIVGIDPKVDYAFKRLYGREETRSILIDLTNSVLATATSYEVADVELLNPFNAKENLDERFRIVSV
jgi:PD-(D/E)XK nuclease family transposase